MKAKSSLPAKRGSKKASTRHDPLLKQIESENQVKGIKNRGKYQKQEKTDDAELDEKTKNKILKQIREQQDEIDMEMSSKKLPVFEDVVEAESEEEEEEEIDEEEDYETVMNENVQLDEEDEAIFNRFMNPKVLDLGSMIKEKLAKAEFNQQHGVDSNTNPKVIEVYQKVGLLLSRYKSGKVPKAFKILPVLKNWEELLHITNPDEWTPHAVFQATKIFVSNLKADMAQKFFEMVLLDRVRRDIAETKKLNYHLYMALKKAFYKPAAFFKGILIPLCESGNCTLREAAIIGSVLSKISIPVLHSSAALLKLAEMEYTGSNSLFIRFLLDKKYALPYRVVDALVFHFLKFSNDDRELPVLWHQSLLVFVQRYKEDTTLEQKEALMQLLKTKNHPGISPEILRELSQSKCREMQEATAMDI